MTAATIGKFYNRPLVIWGPLLATELGDRERFPTTTLNSGTAWGYILAAVGRCCTSQQVQERFMLSGADAAVRLERVRVLLYDPEE